jgi:hypothetical protein
VDAGEDEHKEKQKHTPERKGTNGIVHNGMCLLIPRFPNLLCEKYGTFSLPLKAHNTHT